MFKINLETLNKLELQIFEQLTNFITTEIEHFSINDAAAMCNVSTSKISKTIKKSGFLNFKEFIKFYSEKVIPTSNDNFQVERERITNFINDFDHSVVDDTLLLIEKYKKIIIYGLGPSFICAEYFEYKLRSFTNKSVFAINDKVQLENILDKNSLIIILSTTGKFSSFEDIISIANSKKANILMIFEEYFSSIHKNIKNKIFLTNGSQDNSLLPHEKTRTLTFIFIEEVLSELLRKQKNSST